MFKGFPVKQRSQIQVPARTRKVWNKQRGPKDLSLLWLPGLHQEVSSPFPGRTSSYPQFCPQAWRHQQGSGGGRKVISQLSGPGLLSPATGGIALQAKEGNIPTPDTHHHSSHISDICMLWSLLHLSLERCYHQSDRYRSQGLEKFNGLPKVTLQCC